MPAQSSSSSFYHPHPHPDPYHYSHQQQQQQQQPQQQQQHHHHHHHHHHHQQQQHRNRHHPKGYFSSLSSSFIFNHQSHPLFQSHLCALHVQDQLVNLIGNPLSNLFILYLPGTVAPVFLQTGAVSQCIPSKHPRTFANVIVPRKNQAQLLGFLIAILFTRAPPKSACNATYISPMSIKFHQAYSCSRYGNSFKLASFGLVSPRLKQVDVVKMMTRGAFTTKNDGRLRLFLTSKKWQKEDTPNILSPHDWIGNLAVELDQLITRNSVRFPLAASFQMCIICILSHDYSRILFSRCAAVCGKLPFLVALHRYQFKTAMFSFFNMSPSRSRSFAAAISNHYCSVAWKVFTYLYHCISI